VLATAVALVFDALEAARPFSFSVTGALDEPAHLAFTALLLLVLVSFRPLPVSFVVGALIASVAIDLDHLPSYLGMTGFSAQPGGRPYTHSLVTVAAAGVVALAMRRGRVAAAGVAVGLVTHFVRDVCEGSPGVSLLWPVTSHEFLGSQTDFRWLVVGLAVVGMGAAFRRPLGSGLSCRVPSRGGGTRGHHAGSDARQMDRR
jgi:inner membrane protein